MNITSFFILYAVMPFLCSSLSYVDLLLAGSRLLVYFWMHSTFTKYLSSWQIGIKFKFFLVYRLKRSVNLFHSSLAIIFSPLFFEHIHIFICKNSSLFNSFNVKLKCNIHMTFYINSHDMRLNKWPILMVQLFW